MSSDSIKLMEAVLARDIISRLRDAGIPEEQLNSIKADHWTPETLESLDPWSRRYLEGGHLWGDAPSSCGEFLLDTLPPDSLILDLGCGYGRDSKAYTEYGHRVLAVDMSQIAAIDAGAQLEDSITEGRAGILRADFIRAPILQEKFDAVSTHRMFHLPDPSEINALVNRISGALRANGLLVLTARSPKDFNEEQMDMIDEKTAVYKDRPAHRVNFYDEERLKNTLSDHFTDFSFQHGEEIESIGNYDKDGNPVMSHYLRVIARKKTDAERHYDRRNNGNGNGNESGSNDLLNKTPEIV